MTRKMRRTRHQNRSYDTKINEPIAITPVEYGELQAAYEHFDTALFDGNLGDVFIAYQRRAGMAGHFAADRYSGRIGKFGKHELALNPDDFINKTDEQINQTLVHEMTHVWQYVHGTPSKRGYHNKEWAAKMKEIGLQPSSTGMVGGKETGQRMRDYIIPDGPFTKAFARLAATGWKLNLQSAHRPGPKGASDESKTPFTCPSCAANMWGKPSSRWVCEDCGVVAVLKKAAVSKVTRYRLIKIDEADIDDARVDALVRSYEITEPPVAVIVPSNEPMLPIETKRKPGRPPGSKNKPKRGRPKGSKGKPKDKDVVSYDIIDRHVV